MAASALDAASIRAIADEVARLLGRRESDGLLTARELARLFNVERGWVYAHADELGVVRLGDGPRRRLRFDPAVVALRLRARPAQSAPPLRPSHARGGVPLLPIKPSRSGRNLGPT